jgi:hypothetical protein
MKTMHQPREIAGQLNADLELSDSSDWDNEPDVSIEEVQPEAPCNASNVSEQDSACFNTVPQVASGPSLQLGRVFRQPTRPSLPGKKRKAESVLPVIALGKPAKSTKEKPLKEVEHSRAQILNTATCANPTPTCSVGVQTDFPKHVKSTKKIVEYVKDNTTVKEITEDSYEYY